MTRIIHISFLAALALTGCELLEEEATDTGAGDEGGGDEGGGDEGGGDEGGGDEGGGDEGGGDEGGDDGGDDPDADGDGYPASIDCDDSDPAINPDAVETCGDPDLNCDGVAPGAVTWTNGEGAATDVSDAFNGTSTAPASWTSEESGTLYFCSGTYYANLTANHDLSIETDAPWATTLDGAESGRVLYFDRGTTTKISGVNIKNGVDSYGAGIACFGGVLELDNLSVSHNTAESDGGGISLSDCSASLDTVEVAYNSTQDEGGGISFKSSSIATGTSSLSIHVADIRENEGRNGGGIVVSAYQEKPLVVDFQSVGFYDNSASNVAGGLQISGDTTATMDIIDVYGNSAASYGAGLQMNAYHDDRVNPTLSMTNSDWGEPETSNDNSPDDLVLAGLGDASWEVLTLGDGVSSISCDENGCVVE